MSPRRRLIRVRCTWLGAIIGRAWAGKVPVDNLRALTANVTGDAALFRLSSWSVVHVRSRAPKVKMHELHLRRPTMKSAITIIAIGLLASSLTTSAGAATQRKNAGMAQLQAQCQAQAKKKYSAIHFLKRRAFVKSCMNQKA